jgi:hypothetical protein
MQCENTGLLQAVRLAFRETSRYDTLVVHYQFATSRMNMRRPYGSLLPLEGEGEMSRSKETDSCSDQTPHLNPLPLAKGEAAFAEIE